MFESKDGRDARPLVYPMRLLAPNNYVKAPWMWKGSSLRKIRRNLSEASQVPLKEYLGAVFL